LCGVRTIQGHSVRKILNSNALQGGFTVSDHLNKQNTPQGPSHLKPVTEEETITEQPAADFFRQFSAASTPPPLNPKTIVHLQSQIGNKAVQRLLKQKQSATENRSVIPLISVKPSVQRDTVIQRENDPVGSFHPSAGITVDRTHRELHITGRLQIHGAEATAAIAATIEATIEQFWNANFPDGYVIHCDISVSRRAAGTVADTGATQIEIARIPGPSNVSGSEGARSMVLNLNESDALSWAVAHEFGHILGMRDHYSESVMSRNSGTGGGARQTTPDPGYGGNLMGVTGGVAEQSNVRDLASENAPGWTEDDDQVRDWVNRHDPAAIDRLSANDMIQMIRTLMSGWISDDDVSVIDRICRSVSTSAKATAIRNAIEPELTSMTSIGQRTQVRVSFSRMP
jgi:hypothetical protein